MKRLTATVIALIMVLTMVPTTAMADTHGAFKCLDNSTCRKSFDTLEEAFGNCRQVEVTEDMTLEHLYVPMDAELIVAEGVSLEFTKDATVDTELRSKIIVEKGAKLRLPIDTEKIFSEFKFHAESTVYNAFGPPAWQPDPSKKGYNYRGFVKGAMAMFNTTTSSGENLKQYYERTYGVTLDTWRANNGTGLVANGEPQEPGVAGLEELTEGEDYVIKYWNNKIAGVGEMNVIGIGKYAGFYKSERLHIEPPKAAIKKLTSKKKSITVTAKDQSEFGTEGYNFKYRKAGSSKWKTVKRKEGTKWTVKNLKKNTKYYIKIEGIHFFRSVRPDNYGKLHPDNYISGEWSKTKTIKTKK